MSCVMAKAGQGQDVQYWVQKTLQPISCIKEEDLGLSGITRFKEIAGKEVRMATPSLV